MGILLHLHSTSPLNKSSPASPASYSTSSAPRLPTRLASALASGRPPRPRPASIRAFMSESSSTSSSSAKRPVEDCPVGVLPRFVWVCW
eukprot:6191153-Pleurochrysis_carterae.AAC.1